MSAAEQSSNSKHHLTSQNPKNDKQTPKPDIKMLDGMLTIGQVSIITGVDKTTLRYWEKKYNKFIAPRRIKKSQRQYSLRDIEIIKTIKNLQDEEYLTVKGINLRLNNLYLDHGKKV